MNDFDFDELDKAVSSLASKTREEHGDLIVDERPQTSASSIPAVSRSAAPSPVASREEIEAPKQEVSTPASIPVAAPQKRPIRLDDVRPQPNPRAFMDIVPPSARKTGIHTSMNIRPISKSADIVPEKPAEPVVKTSELMESDDNDLPMVIEQPKHSEGTTPQNTETTWPDPLDFHEDKPAQKTVEPKESEVLPANTTPFLSEAKVEKRPLGAYSHFQTEAPTPEPAKPEKESIPVVDEHDEDEEVTPDKPVISTAPESKPSDDHEEIVKPEKPDMHTAAMMSIPQQYHTQDKSADKTTRPIFDTKEYHPPLVEKAMNEHRGSSMWSKLFIAFVVLVLLAVGGYFLYIYLVHP